ncbi:hypothetical protein ACJZ2D_003696 [Fusarium nematophilum]
MDASFENMDADNPDLRAVQQKGKKVLVYHGLADDGVAPQSAVKYWQESARLTGSVERRRSSIGFSSSPGWGTVVEKRLCWEG